MGADWSKSRLALEAIRTRRDQVAGKRWLQTLPVTDFKYTSLLEVDSGLDDAHGESAWAQNWPSLHRETSRDQTLHAHNLDRMAFRSQMQV